VTVRGWARSRPLSTLFPTRRSSDLSRGATGSGDDALISGFVVTGADVSTRVLLRGIGPGLARFGEGDAVSDPSVALFDAQGRSRSEEHTSELQSRENLVCRLLLEKK